MKSLGTVYRYRMTLLVLHWCMLLCCCTMKGECARCLFLKPPRIVWNMIYDVQNFIHKLTTQTFSLRLRNVKLLYTALHFTI